MKSNKLKTHLLLACAVWLIALSGCREAGIKMGPDSSPGEPGNEPGVTTYRLENVVIGKSLQVMSNRDYFISSSVGSEFACEPMESPSYRFRPKPSPLTLSPELIGFDDPQPEQRRERH